MCMRCRVRGPFGSRQAGPGLAAALLALVLAPPLQGRSPSSEQKEISALRTDRPIQVDGLLDESGWTQAPVARDFIQTEPRQGQLATEGTEVRLLYDDEYLYIGAYCFDSEGASALVVNDLRRDFNSAFGDYFNVLLDTFDDDRNGFIFGTNPRAGKRDGQVGGDGAFPNFDWDGVWHVETRITPEGWQVEMAIPFRTLRFPEGENRVWGINFTRRIRRKNEMSHWAPVPRPYLVSRVSRAGRLERVPRVRGGRNLYLKPYLSVPLSRREGDDTDVLPEAGLDIKYGLGTGLTLDLTANTDFAQVEADEQQINLTRFSLFFPEKRDFFLENSSIFEFGRSLRGFSSVRRDLIPFFSRRIGISSEGRLVPILGGARLTGRAGPYSLGLLSMQTDRFEEDPSTNFSVVRVRRNLLGGSDVGGLFVNRKAGPGDSNRTLGVDLNLNFMRYLDISSFLLKTRTPGLEGKDLAGDLGVRWNNPRLDLQAEYLSIGENFNPELGFVPRRGIRKSRLDFTGRVRPEERLPAIRELRPQFDVSYLTDQENRLLTRTSQVGFATELQNGSVFFLGLDSRFERLDEAFPIQPGQDIPSGDYAWSFWTLFLQSDRSRAVGGEVRVELGDFFGGEKKTLAGEFRYQPGYRLGVELGWDLDDVTLPSGDFTTHLVAARINYSFTTRAFLNALIQYNSTLREVSSNLRFNLIYKPLSDLFLVYNERRDSTGEVRERAFIAKLTYVLDF